MEHTPEEQKALLELLGWGDMVWKETVYQRALSVWKERESRDNNPQIMKNSPPRPKPKGDIDDY